MQNKFVHAKIGYRQTSSAICCCAILLCCLSDSWGATYYVNNRIGNNENDGLSPKAPVATIAKAIQLSQTSDTLELSNTGIAYREPMLFRRLGGQPDRPFLVEGNGAVLSGLKALILRNGKMLKRICMFCSLRKARMEIRISSLEVNGLVKRRVWNL